jgi:hypothetical protein
VNEQEVREVFERLERLGANTPYEVHPDYVLEMPQSGERIRGRDNLRAYQKAYPNPPTIQLRRVVGAGAVWVVEAHNDYGDGQLYHVIDIVQYRDSKIWRETRYYAEPFPAPQWRTQWSSRWRKQQHPPGRQRRRLPHPSCSGPTNKAGSVTERRPGLDGEKAW